MFGDIGQSRVRSQAQKVGRVTQVIELQQIEARPSRPKLNRFCHQRKRPF